MAAPAKKEVSVMDFGRDLVLGGISGTIAKTITAPIEKVKLAIQNQDSNPKILSGEIKRYSGMMDCFMRHGSELGWSSLWRGNVANCVRYAPTAGCNLAFKDFFKNLFPKVSKDKEFAKFAMYNILGGGCAGAVTNTVVYPLIKVRTLLGADIGEVKQYNGMVDCCKKTIQLQGISGLYGGIMTSTIGIFAYRGVQFGFSDIAKAFNPWQKEVTPWALFTKNVANFFAVTCSGLVAYPFDTVQRRMQIETSKPLDQRIYKGDLDCVRVIYAKEGAGGFFKGALANVFRGLGATLTISFYDEIKELFA